MTFGSLKGEFIKDNEMFLSFLCPELFDIAAKCIGGSFMQSILKHSSSVFIKEKLQLSPPHGNDCAYAITVPNDMEDQFSERLISDMNNNFIFDVLNINKADIRKKTPLHIACQNGHMRCVQCLIKYRAAVNETDRNKRTALHYACEAGKEDIVKLLITNGTSINNKDLKAHVNKPDEQDYTPLHIACEYGNEEVVKLLVERKAVINSKNKQDRHL
ncbi:unnamed protein product [Mytilus edulis]|uniref:Uncharacterized protein n=1 Tax=Mytilus edulis TaxID=6550 RepID=A0A8S3UEW6_MYTED|nr:unnamed protein product [Mytilus edulis]